MVSYSGFFISVDDFMSWAVASFIPLSELSDYKNTNL